ncbi:TetR family transcriptional regulator [Streptomyces sp. C184]|uniref:acyl-CoA-like ligand-binding transcription factor n=1 Tax=Streptomyces sp. C184 TaxID=3237121 RepID=UPI0034C5CF01
MDLQHTSPGLRERKKLETRAALRRAAIQLSLERGPSAVTVNEICAAVNVSPRTFFNYFESKEEALFAWDRQLTTDLVGRLARQPSTVPALAALRVAMLDTLPSFGADANWAARTKLLAAHPELHIKLSDCIRRIEQSLGEELARRLGVPVDSIFPQLLSGAAMTALRAALLAWTPGSDHESLQALVAEAFDLLAAGLPDPHSEPDRRR